ncbi:MAG: hypothetical protein ACLUHA_09585 [Bacteroides stercoris]
MKNTRDPQQKVVRGTSYGNGVSETGIIDINLRDMKGNVHKLSDLRKAVILDCKSISAVFSPHDAFA